MDRLLPRSGLRCVEPSARLGVGIRSTTPSVVRMRCLVPSWKRDEGVHVDVRLLIRVDGVDDGASYFSAMTLRRTLRVRVNSPSSASSSL